MGPDNTTMIIPLDSGPCITTWITEQANADTQEAEDTKRLSSMGSIFLDQVDKILPTGRYSVARMNAFRQYRDRTKWWWKLLVIVLSPLPSGALVLALNFIPLVGTDQPMTSQYGFFVRTYVVAVLFMITLKWQREYLLEYSSYSKLQDFLLVNLIAIPYTASYWLLAKLLHRFPVPFSPLIVTLANGPVTMLLLRLMRGTRRQQRSTTSLNVSTGSDNNRKASAKTIATNDRFVKYRRLLAFELSLLFIYSLFHVGFRRLSGIWQVLYTLTLPCLKFWLNRVAKKLISHVEDVAAETVVFSVEFFNAMYISMCMGMAKSNWISVALIAWDLIHMLWSLYRLACKAPLVKEEYQAKPRDMVAYCLRFSRANKNQIARTSSIRMQSSHGIKFESSRFWKWLRAKLKKRRLASGSRRSSVSASSSRHLETSPSRSFKHQLLSPHSQLQTLRQMVVLLYYMERLVLMEYVEVYVPFFYALYVEVTLYSPNQHFFHILHDLTKAEALQGTRKIQLYALVDLMSLVLLYALVKRRFGLNVFDTLAFVLETHFYNIQAKMILFLILILNFMLMHYGMDFDFKFDSRPPISR